MRARVTFAYLRSAAVFVRCARESCVLIHFFPLLREQKAHVYNIYILTYRVPLYARVGDSARSLWKNVYSPTPSVTLIKNNAWKIKPTLTFFFPFFFAFFYFFLFFFFTLFLTRFVQLRHFDSKSIVRAG